MGRDSRQDLLLAILIIEKWTIGYISGLMLGFFLAWWPVRPVGRVITIILIALIFAASVLYKRRLSQRLNQTVSDNGRARTLQDHPSKTNDGGQNE